MRVWEVRVWEVRVWEVRVCEVRVCEVGCEGVGGMGGECVSIKHHAVWNRPFCHSNIMLSGTGPPVLQR